MRWSENDRRRAVEKVQPAAMAILKACVTPLTIGNLRWGNRELPAVSVLGDRSMVGTVTHGDGRGRSLGFPTANLVVEDNCVIPSAGIYASWARVGLSGAWYRGALHIGPRPSFPGSSSTIELHLLDFPDCDLYGQKITVIVYQRIRDIEAFSAEELVAAIHSDCAKTRILLINPPEL